MLCPDPLAHTAHRPIPHSPRPIPIPPLLAPGPAPVPAAPPAAAAVVVAPVAPPGAYAVSPVAEARSGSKAMQLGAGCPRWVYWAGTYAFDSAVHLVVALLALATFAAFGDQATTGGWDRAAATLLLLVGYGLGVAPLAYCCSLGFSSPSSAQVGGVAGQGWVGAREWVAGLPAGAGPDAAGGCSRARADLAGLSAPGLLPPPPST